MAVITQHIRKSAITESPVKVNLELQGRSASVISYLKYRLSGIFTFFKKVFKAPDKTGNVADLANSAVMPNSGSHQITNKTEAATVSIMVRLAFEVNRPKQEVYAFWRQLSNLPLFMTHLKSVEILTENCSRWMLNLPTGFPTVSWEAEILNDEPGSLIEWQSVEGSALTNKGRIRFFCTVDPAVTLMHVAITYIPPAGILGAAVARLFNPVFTRMLEKDIQNFKHFMSGAPTTDTGGVLH